MENKQRVLDRFEGFLVRLIVTGDENDEKEIFIKSISSGFEGYELDIEGIGKFPLKRPREIIDNECSVTFDYSDDFYRAEKLVRAGQPYFSKKQQKELKMTFEFVNEGDYDHYLSARAAEEEAKRYGW